MRTVPPTRCRRTGGGGWGGWMRGCLPGQRPPSLLTDKHMWKHYLSKLRLRAVNMTTWNRKENLRCKLVHHDLHPCHHEDSNAWTYDGLPHTCCPVRPVHRDQWHLRPRSPFRPLRHQTPLSLHHPRCEGTSVGCFYWWRSEEGSSWRHYVINWTKWTFRSVTLLNVPIIIPIVNHGGKNLTWWTNTSSFVSSLKWTNSRYVMGNQTRSQRSKLIILSATIPWKT